MFKNMKLSVKLTGAFGVVLILLAAVLAIYHYTVSSTVTQFDALMKVEVAILNHASEVETLMLQVRRDEKDFLARKDLKYRDQLEKNTAALKTDAHSIEALARKSGAEDIAQRANAIFGYTDDYLENFAGVVESYEKIGLDHKSGLQGEFRGVAHILARKMPDHAVGDLKEALLEIRRYEKDYLLIGSDKYKQKLLAAIETYGTHLQASSCDKDAKESQQKGLARYRDASSQLLAAPEAPTVQDEAYQAMRSAAHDIEDAIASVNVIGVAALTSDIRKNEKDYMLRKDKKYVTATHNAIAALIGAFKDAGVLQEHIDDMEADLKQYKTAFDAMVSEDDRISERVATMRDDVHKIEAMVERLHETAKEAANLKFKTTTVKAHLLGEIAMGVGIGAIIIGMLLSFFLTRSITRPILSIIYGLNEGADQVASASYQVSSASQSLAEGASQQAASIEETSSSLEEMSSMTKQNADNAGLANSLMQDANRVITRANESMGHLTLSMEEISTASDETSKIIKTIDEIAFQTNLLALNAAVEAARAGEAGAGFAVVAEEVRNLAIRSADAAKSTAALIEGTVKKVQEGSELVRQTNDAFTEVAGSSSKVGDLIVEISAASSEQATGIDQVNLAVTEMDKVTQHNAANSEETAGSSEEMNAQAQTMKGLVDELATLISGAAAGQPRSFKEKAPTTIHRSTLPAPGRQIKSQQKVALKNNQVQPDQIIPFDNDSFTDF